MNWLFGRRRIALPAVNFQIPRPDDRDLEEGPKPSPSLRKRSAQPAPSPRTSETTIAELELNQTDWRIPHEVRAKRTTLGATPQLSQAGESLREPARSKFQPNPEPDFELKRVSAVKASKALQDFGLALNASPDDGPGAWNDRVEKAKQALKGLFGDNIAVSAENAPCFAHVSINDVRFVDEKIVETTDEASDLGTLNLDGLCADITLVVTDCELRSLFLQNAKLADLHLRGIDSGNTHRRFWDGVWLHAADLEVKYVLYVGESPARNRASHLTMFDAPRLRAAAATFAKETLINLREQKHWLFLVPFFRALGDFESGLRAGRSSKDEASELAETLRIIRFFGPWNTAYRRFPVHFRLPEAKIGALDVSCTSLGPGNLSGMQIDGSFSISSATFSHSLSAYRPTAYADLTKPSSKREGQQLIDQLHSAFQSVCKTIQILQSTAPTEPPTAHETGTQSSIYELQSLFQDVREWMDILRRVEWLVCLNLRETTIAHTFEIRRMGSKLDDVVQRLANWKRQRLNARALPSATGSDIGESTADSSDIWWNDPANSAWHPRNENNEANLDRLVGHIDFSGLTCNMFKDGTEWWRNRKIDLHYNLSNMQYEFIQPLVENPPTSQISDAGAVPPRPSRDGGDQNTLNAAAPVIASHSEEMKHRLGWLRKAFRDAKDERRRFDAQPWTQCATAMRKAGWDQEADNVLYCRELRNRNNGHESTRRPTIESILILMTVLLSVMAATVPAGFLRDLCGLSETGPWASISPLLPFILSLVLLLAALVFWLPYKRTQAAEYHKTQGDHGRKTTTLSRDLDMVANRLLDWTIGFGYKPWRAALCTILFLFSGTVIFTWANDAGMMASKPGPEFKSGDQKPQSAALGNSTPQVAVNYTQTAAADGKSGASNDPCNVGSSDTPAHDWPLGISPKELRDAVKCGLTDAIAQNKEAIKETLKGGVQQGVSAAGTESDVQLNRFIYSLNRFFPFIDLTQGDEHVPKAYIQGKQFHFSQFLLWCYYWFHTLVGLWVSTVIIAYVTGLLERRQ